MTYALNTPGDPECRHGIDLRYSRCASCEEPPRGGGQPKYAPGEIADAASWQVMATLAFSGSGDGLGPWTEAKWSGRCKSCGERWEPGDRIRRDEDEDAWICEACGVK